MFEQQQNGGQKPPVIPEGDAFLLVRINPKTSEFQCLFSDLISALALHKLADEYIRQNFTGRMFSAAEIVRAPLPGIPAGSMLSHFKKGPGN